MLTEVNIDAIVGPTHHFGGLGVGNVASHAHQDQASSPRKAALQGLEKARLLASLGVPQFLWLPPRRPRLDLLEGLGFTGEPAEMLRQAVEQAPRAVSAAYSSAFMWAANSATVAPSSDASDGRTHFTPANLVSSWHRSSEASERAQDLKSMFPGHGFAIHQPLPAITPLRDEGAANHMRLCNRSRDTGFHLFVYGADESATQQPAFFPRHTRAASEAIARKHRLDASSCYFLPQHAEAISAGVFHNDVIATSHLSLLIHHELAFDPQAGSEIGRLEADFKRRTGESLIRLEVSQSDLPLQDAVSSYFFNSQIVSTADSARMTLVCPEQCRVIESASHLITRLLEDRDCPIDSVRFVALAESMANGGGPACLRLRVLLDESQVSQVPNHFCATDARLDELSSFIETHYPEVVTAEDLSNAEFAREMSHVSTLMREM